MTCYSTFQDGTTNAAGKEAPQSPSPVTPDEHSLRNKSNLLKKCFLKLALAYDNPLSMAVVEGWSARGSLGSSTLRGGISGVVLLCDPLQYLCIKLPTLHNELAG